MKRSMLLCIMLATSGISFAKSKAIVNPVYDFSNTGIMHITKIELGKKETRLHVHSVFIPHWWVKFPKETRIEDCATGKQWQATGIVNGEFDREIYMSDSGDSTFVLIFPPLDKSVTKINFCDNDGDDPCSIFGLSLNPKEKPHSKEMPVAVSQWLDGELAKAKRQTMMDFEAGEFFSTDTARLIGYINGYDKRAGFATGMIYIGNEITREDFPIAIQIHEDGRFESAIPMNYPQYLNAIFKRTYNSFYIQPGQTLAMLLDWEDFRMADRLRNIRYTFRNTVYRGTAADINSELFAFDAQLPDVPYMTIYTEGNKKKPDEFKAFYDEAMSEYSRIHKQLLETEKLSKPTKTFLQNNYQMMYATALFDYEMNYAWSNNKVPLEYYDFLQDLPMNNRELLSTSAFSSFINRFEYCQPFGAKYKAQEMMSPEKTYFQYLFEELNIPKTAEDEDYIQIADSVYKDWGTLTEEERKERQVKDSIGFEQFVSRHGKNSFKDYTQKYMDGIKQLPRKEIELIEWQIEDSVYTNVLKLKPGIMYDIVKIRSLDFAFREILNKDKEGAMEVLTALTADMPEPFLKKEANRLFKKDFPEEQKAAYKLSDTYEAGVFKELIAPFKGKVVLVDFWATTCGPCVGNIKRHKTFREKYKDSPDLAFLFITSEDESPKTSYDKFVAEQELTHTSRIHPDQYRYLRQLFRFNGIPRYVLVDREGDILDDNFQSHQFEDRIKDFIPVTVNRNN